MANYRTGEFMGRPHFWCENCSFDTPNETEIINRPCPNAPGDGSETSAPEEDTRPAPSASKAEWVAYAQAHGIEVEGKTRSQIIETVEVTQP